MVMSIELRDHSDYLMKHWQFEDVVASVLSSVLLTAFCNRQSIGHKPAIIYCIYRNSLVSRIHEFGHFPPTLMMLSIWESPTSEDIHKAHVLKQMLRILRASKLMRWLLLG